MGLLVPNVDADQIIRAVAVIAAIQIWEGIRAVEDRDEAIVGTAKRFERYIREGA